MNNRSSQATIVLSKEFLLNFQHYRRKHIFKGPDLRHVERGFSCRARGPRFNAIVAAV